MSSTAASTVTRLRCSARIVESSSAPSASSMAPTKVTEPRTSRKPGQDKFEPKLIFIIPFTFREIVSRLLSEQQKQSDTEKIIESNSSLLMAGPPQPDTIIPIQSSSASIISKLK